MSRFGWHHTGDLGYLDGDRYLHIVDRKKDMIISGGFNVYSAEVERALARHPAVVESAVVGIPDAHWGERVCAAVVPRPDRQVTADELIHYVRERLGPVRTPKHIELVTQLPRNHIGKVVKPEVRRLIAERLTEED